VYHKRAFFCFVFQQTATTICINLPIEVYIVPKQTAAIKSSKVPFKENASPVRCPVLGIFFFLVNLWWRGVAVNKKHAKVKPRFRSFLQALSSEKNLKNRSSPKAIEIRRN